MRSVIDRAIHGETQLLVRGIEHAIRSRKKRYEAALVAPWKLSGIPKHIHQFSSSEASAVFGFHIEYEVGDVMPVIDAYIAPQQHLGNSIAKRYLRWRERF